MWQLFSKELLAPEGTEKGGGSSVEDIVSSLGKDDDNEPETIELPDDKKKTKELEDEEEQPEEIDELKEIEEELEEPSEEQLELVTPSSKRDILAKYPKIFKDFPYLEKAYYREQQYTEVFPNPADAKKAAADSETLGYVETDLMNGNTEQLLKAAKNENPKAFNKIVDNYLEVLGKVDEKARDHVIGNVIKQTIVFMAREAQTQGESGTPLLEAANILNQFVFGSSKFTHPTKLSKDEPDTKDDTVNREKEQWETERFETARDDLGTRVNNSIQSTIEQHIDPKSSMSDYVKRTAVKEALDSVSNLIDKDPRFKVIINKLWDNARHNRYNKESTDKIRSAFLSKAKTLLPTVIKSARNEALKGMGKRVHDDDNEPEEKESSNKKEKSTTPKTHERGQKQGKVPKGMTSLEYLMQD